MRKSLGFIIKIVVSLLALGYIVYKLSREADSLTEIYEQLSPADLALCIASLLLVIANIGLEALKWQTIVKQSYPDLTFTTAFQAVLSGITTGIFTPNNVGEYAGRVLYLAPGHRVEAIALTFVDKSCQMLITLWAGSLAFVFVAYHYLELIKEWIPLSDNWLYLLLMGLFIGNVFGTWVVLNPDKVLRLLNRKKIKYSWLQKAKVAIEQLESPVINKVLLLAVCRYAVFSLQYYLLMLALGYQGSLALGLGIIWIIFLLKSIIPSIAFAELGIRETVAIAVMGAFGIAVHIAFGSTFILYLINIILPACLGLFFIQRLKLSTPDSSS